MIKWVGRGEGTQQLDEISWRQWQACRGFVFRRNLAGGSGWCHDDNDAFSKALPYFSVKSVGPALWNVFFYQITAVFKLSVTAFLRYHSITHIKDPGHSATSAGGRLQLNPSTPYVCGFQK